MGKARGRIEKVMKKRYTMVGLGELLWDMLPGGKHLGGGPANFAYFAHILGDNALVASRVGEDALGREALQRLRKLGLRSSHVQLDPVHPTSSVRVEIDKSGQPRFTITRAVAWDFLSWTPAWKRLAQRADVVCFGSLAQRSAVSRKAVLMFLRSTRPATLRVFDVNLRPPFYSTNVISNSLRLANIVKVNDEELPHIMKRMNLSYSTQEKSALTLLRHFNLRLVCVTQGSRGSVLVTQNQVARHRGVKCSVADTVGAGDAFTAALVHHYLRGAPLDRINEAANRLGSWVASQPGATPPMTLAQRAILGFTN